MSGKSGNEKNHEYHSKIDNREHKIPILNSKDFYYSRSRERLYRHLRGRLKHGRSMEGREREGSSTSKVFIGIFYFAINERKNNLNKIKVANQSLTKKIEKTPKSANKKSCTSRKKILRQNVKKVPLELVPSKLERHLKLC